MIDPHSYPPAASSATTALQKIKDQIHQKGILAFPAFMDIALYHPECGYYAASTQQVGKSGDFFTSVSVGSLFGELLAADLANFWKTKLGAPPAWRVIELGAHTGTLAHDVLAFLASHEPAAFTALEYRICEPQATLRSAQQQTLAEFSKNTQWCELKELPSLAPLPGVVFGNELLDALPFHVVTWTTQHGWREKAVTLAAEELAWTEIDAAPEILKQLAAIDTAQFPDGYETEIRDSATMREFFQFLTTSLAAPSAMWWIDYGFAAPELYHPYRSTGTLRTFSQHQAGENPLDRPGEKDITAHVDFTAVAHAAAALGFAPTYFHGQGSWLIPLAAPRLLDGSLQSKLAAFQTLTHPSQLGGKFHILKLERNAPACPIATRRLSLS